jgi:hypothetical protein
MRVHAGNSSHRSAGCSASTFLKFRARARISDRARFDKEVECTGGVHGHESESVDGEPETCEQDGPAAERTRVAFDPGQRRRSRHARSQTVAAVYAAIA